MFVQENIFSLDEGTIDRPSFSTPSAADKPQADGRGEIF